MEAQVSAKVRAAIMQKCTQEEVQAVLKEIPDDETDQAVGTRVSTLMSGGLWIFQHGYWVYGVSNLGVQNLRHFSR